MAIAIANVELTNSFDQWRITTNQMIDALNNQVVTKEDFFVENILDSVEVDVEPIILANPQGDKTPTDTVQIKNLTGLTTDANLAKFANFKAGQKVRIYGARLNGTTYTAAPTPAPPTFTKIGFTTGTGRTSTFTYKIAQFDLATGKVSEASTEVPINQIDITGFNTSNNIELNITRSNTNQGVLVYRKITGTGPNDINQTSFHLIAVLGTYELVSVSDTWEDLYDFDNVVWSRKNNRNEFTTSSGLIHFPLTAPSAPKFGWIDAEINFVDTTFKRLTFTQTFLFEDNVVVSHDDTNLIQSAINDRVATGIKSLELPTKLYIVKGITVANNFSIIGNGSKTTLRKLSWSSNFDTTGNRILKSNALVSDFSLSDIVLDGNMQNQYLLNEAVDDKVNYTVDVTGNTFRYENLKISNVIGSGISAINSNSISVISSFILDSNLNDRDEFSPLSVDESRDVVLSSNLFRNFSGPISASTLSTGSIVGNIIKNCGSGLLIFGSTNLISSPNILMGPANEFLPSPDILNSAYDSINIKLEPNTPYESDVINYQENGESANLSPLSANRVSIQHRVDRLQKVQTTESLYGNEILINGIQPLQSVPGTDLNNGNFKYSISGQNVDILLNDYVNNFDALRALNSNHIGIIYRSIATEYVPSGNVNVTTTSPLILPGVPVISRPINANNSGVNNTTNTLKINNVLNDVRIANTYFKVGDLVYYNLPATNTAITGLTANTTYYVSFANNTDIALSATYNGANIDLNEIRVATPSETHNLNKTAYVVALNNLENLYVGAKVRFKDHGGDPNLNNLIGTVVSFSSITGLCEIYYDPTINIATAGENGQITVEKSYVLAKGRIL